MKADSNFRMSKTTKRVLGTFTDKEARRLYKDVMVRAQAEYERNKKKSVTKSDKSDKE